MKLLIDTADPELIQIGLAEKGTVVASRKLKAKYRQAEKLLPAITKLLATKKLGLRNLTAVAVISGPGPFTALRIGVVTANTIAFALRIPIVGVRRDQAADLSQLAITAEKRRGGSKPVIPFYGQEPHITLKK